MLRIKQHRHFAGHQTIVPRALRQAQGIEEAQPISANELPGLAGSVGTLSRLAQKSRKGGRPEFAVHPHTPPAERVPAAPGERNAARHDGTAEKAEDRDGQQVPEASGQGAGDRAARAAKLARTHGD